MESGRLDSKDVGADQDAENRTGYYDIRGSIPLPAESGRHSL